MEFYNYDLQELLKERDNLIAYYSFITLEIDKTFTSMNHYHWSDYTVLLNQISIEIEEIDKQITMIDRLIRS